MRQMPLVVLFLWFVMPFCTSAQATSVTITTNVSIFNPGESVVLRAESNTIDLDLETITWSVNGTEVKTGRGAQSITVSVPEKKMVRVSVLVTRVDEVLGAADMYVGPSSVNILWESTGYTHPFYRGRALVAPHNTLKAEARAQLFATDGTLVPKSDVEYEWSVNNRVIGSHSGKGKSVLLYPTDDFSSVNTLAVRVSSPIAASYAQTQVRVPMVRTYPVLYQVHPLSGVDFQNAITESATVLDSEATFALVPYFAPTRILDNRDVRVSWSINGLPLAPDTIDDFLITTVAPTEDTRARLRAVISYVKELTNGVERAWDLSFSQNSDVPLEGDLFMPEENI